MFFVVPGNGQVLLRMPDMAALNIINLNIDSIQAEVAEFKINIVCTGNADCVSGLNKHSHR